MVASFLGGFFDESSLRMFFFFFFAVAIDRLFLVFGIWYLDIGMSGVKSVIMSGV